MVWAGSLAGSWGGRGFSLPPEALCLLVPRVAARITSSTAIVPLRQRSEACAAKVEYDSTRHYW